ncbi:MAG TPA: hypothetical protein VMK13_09950 [Streptosporangiaceae bacterium]|nr:hypothetical protein [Streptosporangiaceae bacterium]
MKREITNIAGIPGWRRLDGGGACGQVVSGARGGANDYRRGMRAA